MILMANTVVDPWTMMIHFQNTFIACRTMMCSIRLIVLTKLAVFYTCLDFLTFSQSRCFETFFLIIIFELIFQIIIHVHNLIKEILFIGIKFRNIYLQGWKIWSVSWTIEMSHVIVEEDHKHEIQTHCYLNCKNNLAFKVQIVYISQLIKIEVR